MNLDIYTSEMAKSVWDKAFFMDKIPGTKCVIDFGCADGAMIRFLAPLYPDVKFIGYDISNELIERAKNTHPTYTNVAYFTNVDDMITYIKERYNLLNDEFCINFSSVLHEVFSTTREGKEVITKLVNTLIPKYITVRDMYFDGENEPLSYYMINSILDNLEIDNGEGYIEEFEDTFGTIALPKNMVHFLMKYQWRNNGWDKELEEDYFSWNIQQLINIIGWQYNVVFKTHYMLPYLADKWDNTFLRPTTVHTHAQFILRRGC